MLYKNGIVDVPLRGTLIFCFEILGCSYSGLDLRPEYCSSVRPTSPAKGAASVRFSCDLPERKPSKIAAGVATPSLRRIAPNPRTMPLTASTMRMKLALRPFMLCPRSLASTSAPKAIACASRLESGVSPKSFTSESYTLVPSVLVVSVLSLRRMLGSTSLIVMPSRNVFCSASYAGRS